VLVIYPKLILALSEAIDEIGAPSEVHLAVMSFALAVIVSLLTGINKHFWHLTLDVPSSVSSLVTGSSAYRLLNPSELDWP
jgi:uncharacterized membrane protein